MKTTYVLAAKVTLRGLAHGAVHQQPIILGVPNQLFALRRSPQGIDKFRLPAFENHLVFVHIIFGVLRCPGAGPVRSRLYNLHLAVGEGMVER